MRTIFISSDWQEDDNSSSLRHYLTHDLNANNFKIVNLKDPSLGNDATSKQWVESHTLDVGECSALVREVGEKLFMGINATRSNLNLNGNRIVNVGQPIDNSDTATKEWVENQNLSIITLKINEITNPIKRVALHSSSLSFSHPISGKLLRFQSDPPPSFYLLANPYS